MFSAIWTGVKTVATLPVKIVKFVVHPVKSLQDFKEGLLRKTLKLEVFLEGDFVKFLDSRYPDEVYHFKKSV